MTELNCKPGDRAIVENPGKEGHGATMKIIKRAPEKEFKLPNGQVHEPQPADEPGWVVKLDRKHECPTIGVVTKNIMRRMVVYGVVRDSILRPLDALKAPK